MIMELAERLFRGKALSATTPGPADDFWYGGAFGAPTKSGIAVNESTALNFSAVWAATCIISETIASIPCITYEETEIAGGVGKRRAKDHSLYRVLRRSPNPEMDAFTFWESGAGQLVNWGNRFAEKERDGMGRVVKLWPIHASRIPRQNMKREGGEIVYYVKNDQGPPTRIAKRDMFHVVGSLSDDGLYGKGVIAHARESIGGAMAVEQHGHTFFGNNARPAGVLQKGGPLTTQAADTLRDQWNKTYGGPGNANKIAVLVDGTEYKPIDIPNEQAQFLQTRQFNIQEIARWYRLPPHVLADLSRSSFSNVESEMLSFIVHSMRRWFVRIEAAINTQLFIEADADRYFAEFLLDALLRGDTAARAAASKIEFQNGALTINEWRARENRNPIPGGDEHFVPLNMTTLRQVIEGTDEDDEPVDPPAPPSDPVADDGDDLAAKPTAELRACLDAALADWIGPPPVVEANDAEIVRIQADLDQQNAAIREAARLAVVESAGRMLRKEAAAARRASGEPGKFLAWMDGFYVKHAETLADAMGPALASVRASGRAADDAAIVAEHVARSRDDLLAAAGVEASQFASAVDTCVAAWESGRADSLANQLLGG